MSDTLNTKTLDYYEIGNRARRLRSAYLSSLLSRRAR